MIFSLNFYQKDAVSTNREAATYQVYFTDEDGKQISDIQKIIADKTSDNGAERTFRCQFNLKSLKYSNTSARSERSTIALATSSSGTVSQSASNPTISI